MTAIGASQVKELREQTGAGMMDCKRALQECGGEFEKAKEWLRKKGITKAQSKSGRIAAEGLLGLFKAADERRLVAVEVNSETDFVARNPEFCKFAQALAEHIAQCAPQYVRREEAPASAEDAEILLEQAWTQDASKKVKDVLTAMVATIGENIGIRRFSDWQAAENSVLGCYMHSNQRLVSFVELSGSQAPEAVELAKELALQVAGMNPLSISREKLPPEWIAKEKEMVCADPSLAKRPAAIQEKIIQGKLEKYFESICLVDQFWFKDDKKKISQLVGEVSKKLGLPLGIERMLRLQVGEGIEKKQDNLAEEVAKTLAG
ncbi:MAG: translation elongation factor Ts [Cystobacterineae bacterium]|nr:translation elongation factor Ts [Cystobacterineae bacterium]